LECENCPIFRTRSLSGGARQSFLIVERTDPSAVRCQMPPRRRCPGALACSMCVSSFRLKKPVRAGCGGGGFCCVKPLIPRDRGKPDRRRTAAAARNAGKSLSAYETREFPIAPTPKTNNPIAGKPRTTPRIFRIFTYRSTEQYFEWQSDDSQILDFFFVFSCASDRSQPLTKLILS